MPQPWSDVTSLSLSWEAAVGPSIPPLGSELRAALPTRWVRFHTLPEGQRIAATQPQRQEVLTRYRTVLEALDATAEERLLVTTCGWAPTPPAARVPDLAELMPGTLWQSLPPGTPGDQATSVYATALDPADGGDDEALGELLLIWVADDRTADVVVAPPSCAWLAAPYDGGIDVIARDATERSRLADRFHDWLSPLPSGL